jgi:hypothetical protein
MTTDIAEALSGLENIWKAGLSGLADQMSTSFKEVMGGDVSGRLGMAGLGAAGSALGVSKLLSAGISNQAELKKLMSALGTSGVDLTTATYDVMHKFGDFGNEYYGTVQETFGGIQNINKILNKTSKEQVEALDTITGIFFNNTTEFGTAIAALTVETATGTKRQVNALTAYFENVDEVVQNYASVFDNLRYTQTLRMNDMTETSKAMLGTFEKGFGVSNRKIAEVLDRTIALTGKASIEAFGEISNFSKVVADKTGIDYKNIAQTVIELRTDVEKFGNVHVDAAARIAGALGQIGVSYSGFSGMIGRFQGFDSAAGSLGNLTTLFGVHFDAMEMMMLANEDQEEFLYRMRDAFMETGMSIDDMTLAEKKLAAQELGMGVQDFENFMRGEREISDLTAETAEAANLTMAQGFETMTQQMKLIKRDSKAAKEYMKDAFFQPIRKDAKITADRLALMFHGILKMTPEAAKKIRAQLQSQLSMVFQTDVGTQQIFEDLFLAKMQSKGPEKLAKPEIWTEMLAKYKKEENILTIDELQKTLVEGGVSKEDFAVWSKAYFQATVGGMKYVNQAIEKDYTNQIKLMDAYQEMQADVSRAALRELDFKSEMKSIEYSPITLRDDKHKASLVTQFEKLITDAANSKDSAVEMKMVNEYKAVLKAIQEGIIGSTDQQIVIKLNTSVHEARIIQQALQDGMNGTNIRMDVGGG